MITRKGRSEEVFPLIYSAGKVVAMMTIRLRYSTTSSAQSTMATSLSTQLKWVDSGMGTGGI